MLNEQNRRKQMIAKPTTVLTCLALPLTLLLHTVLAQTVLAQTTDMAAEIEKEITPGKYEGAANATHPAWFKESFLDFGEDIDEASAAGRRLALYFWQPGCPYCNRLWEHNMEVDGINESFSASFDVVAINMWGDQEVVTVGGKQFSEKQLARALDVDFTPTLLFYDENRKIVLRLNGYLPPERFKLALDYAAGDHQPGQSFNAYVADKSSTGGELARSQEFFKSASDTLVDRRQAPGKRPLAVIFETADCASCEEFHDVTLKHKETRGLLANMDVVQLDARSENPVMLPDGQILTPAKWAGLLKLSYYPSLVFFDEAGEQIMLMNAYFRNFHTQSVFAYVLDKGYLKEPSFQRYISARVEKLNEEGIDVDIWAE